MKMEYNELASKKEKIAVVGLGYVGMPLAVAFARYYEVIGFDTNEKKIELYQSGYDPTQEVGNEIIRKTSIDFTSDESRLREAKFYVVAVPTPVKEDNTPDLKVLEKACEKLGNNLSQDSIIVFESTVYPGVTEKVCVPILEKCSGFKCGVDFKVGYSPERINPGDKVHRLNNITKIVSGMDEESLNIIEQVYSTIIDAGVYKVSSIKVAEAAKVIENSQRDVNIAFVNEVAQILDRMDINTNEVIDAMNTKWNALNFRPGLVGGHCIGVDPFYLTYEAEKLGYHSQIIASARKINNGMGEFVALNTIKRIANIEKPIHDIKLVVMGITFKENCPDIRNSKVIDIIHSLKEYGIEPIVTDPWANDEEVYKEYGIRLEKIENISEVDVIILAVAHNEYVELCNKDVKLLDLFAKELPKKVLIDVKGIAKNLRIPKEYIYWSV